MEFIAIIQAIPLDRILHLLSSVATSCIPCFNFNAIGVLGYLYLYLVMKIMVSGHKKSHVLCSNVVAMLACWRFLYTYDFDGLVAYYWYDLLLSVIYSDYFMVAHHCLSLYALMQCPTHPDYLRICYATIYLKSSDIFACHYKITDALNLYSKYPIVIRLYQMLAILTTIIMWMYYRVYRPLVLYPFDVPSFQYIAILFHVMFLYWIIKMSMLLNRVAKKAYIEFQDTIK